MISFEKCFNPSRADPKAICFLDFPAENNGAHKIVQKEASFQVPLISFCFCKRIPPTEQSKQIAIEKSTFSYFKTFAQIIEKTPSLPSYVPDCHHIRKHCHQHTNWTMSCKDLLFPAKVIFTVHSTDLVLLQHHC